MSWTGSLALWARALGAEARFELLLRAGAYGLSLVAVPLFGPALLPVAAIWMLVAEHAALEAQGAGRAVLPLVANAVLWALPFALLWLR